MYKKGIVINTNKNKIMLLGWGEINAMQNLLSLYRCISIGLPAIGQNRNKKQNQKGQPSVSLK